MASAFITTPIAQPTSIGIIQETDCVKEALEDVRAGSTKIHDILMVYPADAGGPDDVYLKLYDNSGEDLNVGTDGPDIIWPVEADASDPVVADLLIVGGYEFVNGLTIVASQEPGNTVTADPTEDLDLRMVVEDTATRRT